MTASRGALPPSADDLEDFFEEAPCGYILADQQSRIVRANRTLAGWLESDPDDLVGRHFSELLSIGGKLFYETHFAPLLRMSGAISEVAVDLAWPKGVRIPVIVNAVERRDNDGEVQAVWIVLIAAPERRRYERNLLDAKASAEQAANVMQRGADMREQLVAVLGHDLRNPVAAISSGLRLLRREAPGDRAQKVIGLMEGSVVRASVLIDNVLDFARGRLGSGIGLTLEMRKPLAPVLEQVVAEMRLIAPNRQIGTRIDIPRLFPVDHGRLGQLVSNLLGNALIHGAEDRPVFLDAAVDADIFELSVANGGDAIPEETLANLFKPFYRGAAATGGRQGLGLGLHIASEIAKAHGGTLTVTSSGKETRFIFRMPAPPVEGQT